MEKTELWQTALTKIELNLSRPNFLTWFQGTAITSMENGVAVISVPNVFVKEWLQNKYHKIILHALRELSGEVKEINYNIGKADSSQTSTLFKENFKKKYRTPSPTDSFELGDQSIKEFSVNPDTNLNPRYTFGSFVVGSFNELAHAAAQSVVNNLGITYNPLFIYGGVGLGKTHLIQAIGNKVIESNPNLKVRYLPSERFMIEIVDALKNQEMNTLKEKYRSVDLLIMDDIQFIGRTEKMQEEFFHTFNNLYEKNRQVVISSDRPPQAISTLEERLRSRFEGGMIADIGQPDYETRLTILKAKLEYKKASISEEILRFIAENVKTNVRELEGALNRVLISARLSRTPLDTEQAKKAVANHLAAPKKFISAKKIIKAVSEFYDIEERDFLAHSRKRDLVRPRQIAMYIMRDELKISYPSIGEKFGGRDHTTVIHSCGKIAEELKVNSELEEELRAVKEKIFSL